jgi:hypothetical protein
MVNARMFLVVPSEKAGKVQDVFTTLYFLCNLHVGPISRNVTLNKAEKDFQGQIH